VHRCVVVLMSPSLASAQQRRIGEEALGLELCCCGVGIRHGE
jgi:hypothetical protein